MTITCFTMNPYIESFLSELVVFNCEIDCWESSMLLYFIKITKYLSHVFTTFTLLFMD